MGLSSYGGHDIGGKVLAGLGNNEIAKKMSVVGIDNHGSFAHAVMIFNPKGKNTPATIAIAMGRGNQSITVLIFPLSAMRIRRAPVTR